MKTAGVIIARFQTPYLHQGHSALIDFVNARHERTIVVLGVSPVKPGKRNPFDFATRKKMLEVRYPSLVILPLRDNASDAEWSRQLDALLLQQDAATAYVLYGSRNSFASVYSGRFEQAFFPEVNGICGTQVRELHANEVLASEDFRKGINYACQHRYPTVYTTVDIALFNQDSTHILLGKKPGAAGWRLPGGFADPTDNNFEAAAKRELTEECGSLKVTPMRYLASAKINDWRYRGEEDQLITLLFGCNLAEGEPQAGDDLETVAWFAVADLPGMLAANAIDEAHVQLVTIILNHTKQSI